MALPRTSWEDGTLPAAWQELAAHAGDKPWLRKLLTERRRVAQNPAPRLALIAWRYSLWKERLQRLRPGQRSRLQRRLGVSLAGAALLLALAAAPGLGAPVAAAPAAAITVTDGTGTIANDLSCSLPEAIINANADNQSGSTDCVSGAYGLDTIYLYTPVGLTASHNSTYGPTGLPVVTSAITIEGNGNTISRSGGTFRIMAVGSGGDLTLNSATVSGGVASGSSPAYDGGGIYARSATLAVTNSTLSGNSATLGAGIWAHSATVTVSNSTLSGNLASNQGGGINAFLATVTVTNSTLSGNIASGFGGGIMAFAATVVVTNSTLSSNSGAQGGGIYAQSSPVTVTNSTLSGNSASSVGGGINVRFATLAVSNSTLSGNSASYFGGGIRALSVTVAISYSTLSGNSASTDGGIHHSAGTITLRSSIVALQTAGGDCNTTVTSGGYNIESGTSCGFTDFGTGDQQSVTSGNLNLKPLANTGGPTETRALGYASVALDQIPFGVNGCGDLGQTDQRGITRPQDWGTNDSPDKCDVGAWEGKPNGPNAVTLAGLQATSGGGPAGLWGAALAGLGGLGLSAFLSRRRGRPTAAGDSAASTLAAAVQQGAPLSLRPSSVSSSTYTPPAITSRGRLRHFSGSPLAVDPNDPLHLSP